MVVEEDTTVVDEGGSVVATGLGLSLGESDIPLDFSLEELPEAVFFSKSEEEAFLKPPDPPEVWRLPLDLTGEEPVSRGKD